MFAFIKLHAGLEPAALTIVPVSDIRLIQERTPGGPVRLLVGSSLKDSTTLDVTETARQVLEILDSPVLV